MSRSRRNVEWRNSWTQEISLRIDQPPSNGLVQRSRLVCGMELSLQPGLFYIVFTGILKYLTSTFVLMKFEWVLVTSVSNSYHSPVRRGRDWRNRWWISRTRRYWTEVITAGAAFYSTCKVELSTLHVNKIAPCSLSVWMWKLFIISETAQKNKLNTGALNLWFGTRLWFIWFQTAKRIQSFLFTFFIESWFRLVSKQYFFQATELKEQSFLRVFWFKILQILFDLLIIGMELPVCAINKYRPPVYQSRNLDHFDNSIISAL